MWRVHETHCSPCSFKVNNSPNPDEGDNTTCNFFRTSKEAEKEACSRSMRDMLQEKDELMEKYADNFSAQAYIMQGFIENYNVLLRKMAKLCDG